MQSAPDTPILDRLRRDLAQALAEVRSGVLSVIDVESGRPYGALVNLAATPDGRVVTLLSTLAKHTQGLAANGSASLLVTGQMPAEGDILTGFRASLMGDMRQTEEAALRDAFLKRHPYAAAYADFGDFAFWTLAPATVHCVAGFGRIVTVKAEQLFPLA